MAGRRKHSGLAATGTVDLAGSALTCPCHVCALYSGAEDQYATLLPFFKEGIAAGERIFSVVDADEVEERRNRLRHAGIDVDRAERDGQLVVQTWEDVYLVDGRFEVDAMLALVQETINTGRQLGFKRTRGWANMEWALLNAPGVENLAIYESRLNYILPLYAEAVVCAYDVTRFSPDVLEGVTRAHPQICAGGWSGSHPLYEPPDMLVSELERKLS